jgi:phosphopantetheinyl transferase (holo-ACP synthase)
MIVGLGNDLTRISRVWNIYTRRGDQFLKKFLHEKERAKFAQLTGHEYKRSSYLAGR